MQIEITSQIERRISPREHQLFRNECYEMAQPYVRRMAELRMLFTTPKMTFSTITGACAHSETWNDDTAHECYDKLAAFIEYIPMLVVKQWEMLGRL